MTDYREKVYLEGDATSIVAAYDKAASSAAKMEVGIGRSGKAIDVFDQATKQAAKGVDKLASTQVKAVTVATGLAKAANSAKDGTLSIASAALQAASAFGPWGAAIGIAGGALLSYASASDQAAAATARLREEERKASDEKFARQLQEVKDRQSKKEARDAEAKAEQHRLALLQSQIENGKDLAAIEEALAEHGRGKDTLALQKREVEIRAEYLRVQEDVAGAAKLERDFQLHTLTILGQQTTAAAKRNKELYGKDLDADMKFRRSLSVTNPGGSNLDAENERRRFAAGVEASRGPLLQRRGSDTRDLVSRERTTANELRQIEAERAAQRELDVTAETGRIEREKQARLSLIEVQRNATDDAAEIRALEQERLQADHDANMQRIALEIAAEEKKLARREAIMGATDAVVRSGMGISALAVKASGASAAKQEKIAGRLAGVESLFIGGLETVKAAAAYASLNIPQGIAHTAAAALAFTQGGLMLSGKLPTGSGGGGGASAATSAAPSQSSSSGGGPTPYTGPIPGSPGPQSPSSGGGGKPWGGGMVVNLVGGNYYGAPPRRWVRDLREQLNEDKRHHRGLDDG
jgi:hypothetical protein